MSIANKRLSIQNSRLLYRNIGTVMFYTAYQDYAADNRKKRKKRKKKSTRYRTVNTPVFLLVFDNSRSIITPVKRATIGGAHRTRTLPGSKRMSDTVIGKQRFYVLLTRMSRFELRVYQQHNFSGLSRLCCSNHEPTFYEVTW